MFPLSIILLILSAALLLIYFICHWMSYVPLKRQEDSADFSATTSSQSPSISVVIISRDSEEMLEYTIDLVARQHYDNFEILIVNNASQDNTNDVIKRAVQRYPELIRYTYLPQSRNGIIHDAMATTLGVRAARKQWVVLLRPNSTPKSEWWLASLANAIDNETEMVVGHNDYYGYDQDKWVRRTIASRRKAQILNFRAISRGQRKPLEVECSNVALKKEDFFNNSGYRSWLNVKFFHESLYATTFATKGTTRFLTQKDAQVETLLPPIQSLWQTERRERKKAFRHFSLSTKLRRSHYAMLTMLYIFSALLMSGGIFLMLCPLGFDNSYQVIDAALWSERVGGVPLLPSAVALIFLLLSLLHYITKLYFNRRDIARISCELVSSPTELQS